MLSYLQAENAYCVSHMQPCDAVKETLYQEMVARIPAQDASVPYVKRGYRYQTRYESGKEYTLYVRQPASETEQWQLLLDENERAADSEFYHLGALSVSPDNRLLALAENKISRRQYDIRFRNLESGEWLPDVIEHVSENMQWNADATAIYYVRKHLQTLLPYQVFMHRLGEDVSQDRLVYEEHDDTYYISLGETTSEAYIVIYLSSTTSTEVRLLDAHDSDAEPQVFIPRCKDYEYGVDHYQGAFYLRSNREGKNFGLYRTVG